MSMDFLNQLASQAKPSAAPEYRPHPLGEFHGVVISVENKYVSQMSNSVIEIKAQTTDQSGQHVGTASVNHWMFSNEEQQRAQQYKEDADKLIARINKMKRMFVDLQVVSQQEAEAMNWTEMLESFEKLKGQKCSVTVKANIKPGKPAMVYFNAPVETVTGVTGPAPDTRKPSPSPITGMPQMPQMGHPGMNHNPMSPPVYGQPSQQGAYGMHPNMAAPKMGPDGIPF